MGRQNPTYGTPPTSLGDSGAIFTVAVTNSAGTVTSVAGTTSLNVENVTQDQAGLGGFVAQTTLPSIYPGNANDIIGVRFNFQAVKDEDSQGRIMFGWNSVYTPGQTLNSTTTSRPTFIRGRSFMQTAAAQPIPL
jgi:hypothetical protein